MKKKSMSLLLAVVLVLTCAAGGTLAWLTASTDEVKNTFTTSDIDITLEETKTEFKMIPGYTIEKDPKVTVKQGSEDCYLFVKLEKSQNFDNYMTYELADGWIELTVAGADSQSKVYYREIRDVTGDTEFSVLKNDQVTVKGEVTKAMMQAAEIAAPTLTVTAYASQLHKNANDSFTALEAWQNVQPAAVP